MLIAKTWLGSITADLALLVSSARFKKEKNLVIFPDQLSKPSLLKIVNTHDLPEPQ
jgi:hypothetical protein